MHCSKRGFTLVELLVVIAIIGLLVALLIPAVQSARESGRQTTCLSNQKQIGEAMFVYEVGKGHLPGVLTLVSTSTISGAMTPPFNTYTWAEALAPYLDRADLWNLLTGKNVGQNIQIVQTLGLPNSTMHWSVMSCPDDPYSPTSGTAGVELLSYGVNDGFFVSDYPNGPTRPPVDRNNTPQAPAILSKLTTRPNPPSFPRGQSVTSSTTIMIGERTGKATYNTANCPYQPINGAYPYPGTYPSYGPTTKPYPICAGNSPFGPGRWTDQSWTTLTFHWPTGPQDLVPAYSSPPPQWRIYPDIMASSHPGIVIVTFFDGHTAKVNDDTQYIQNP